MTSGVLLGLTAALCWGVADVFMRGASRMSGVFLTLLYTEIVAVVGFLLAMGPLGLLTFTHATPGALLAAAALNLLILGGAGLLYRAFAVGTLALVSPLAASFAAVTTLLSLFSGERPTLLAGVGLALTLVGVIVASLVPSPQPHDKSIAGVPPSHTNGKGTRGLGLLAPGVPEVLGAVLIFGVAYWALRYVTPIVGGVQVAFIGKLVDLAALLALAGVVALAAVARPQSSRSQRQQPHATALDRATATYRLRLPPRLFWLFITPGALLDTAANVAYNIGVTGALTSVVATISSLFSAVTVLLAWVFLKERLATWQWLGVASILVGVALINWGG